MKKFKKILLIGVAVLVLIRPVAALAKRDRPVPGLNKSKNLFVFRSDRDFIGARVDVLFADGEVITTQTLQKRKMIIDFCDVKYGTYTIRVIKGDRVKEYQFEKK